MKRLSRQAERDVFRKLLAECRAIGGVPLGLVVGRPHEHDGQSVGDVVPSLIAVEVLEPEQNILSSLSFAVAAVHNALGELFSDAECLRDLLGRVLRALNDPDDFAHMNELWERAQAAATSLQEGGPVGDVLKWMEENRPKGGW